VLEGMNVNTPGANYGASIRGLSEPFGLAQDKLCRMASLTGKPMVTIPAATRLPPR